MVEQACDARLPMKYLIRDRDNKYNQDFDQIFQSSDCRIEVTGPQAPNQYAFIERWIKSIRYECLKYFMVFGKRHLDYLVASYLDYCNELRPHQSLDNRPLSGKWSVVDEPLGENEQIVCQEKLGGLLRHYERIAA